MFLPPKLKTTFSALLALTVVAAATDCFAQSAEFEKRAAAMRRAISRGQQSQQIIEGPTYIVEDSPVYDAPEPVERVARAPRRKTRKKSKSTKAKTAKSKTAKAKPARAKTVAVETAGSDTRYQATSRTSSPVVQTRIARQGSGSRSYVPQHLRTGQFIGDGTIIDGGAPVINGGIVESYPSSGGGQVISGGYDQDIIIDEGYPVGGEIISDYSCGSGCNSCGTSGAYFEDDCCGRGGCPDCYRHGPCWLDGLRKALYNGEYFGGAVAFQSPLFSEPGQDDPNQLASDSSFGFYGGFNLGVPLCRLSGGLLSGQFGIRSVSTNFNGNEFTNDDRRQIFVTTGLYRRVDYGLQFGVVADILHEEWFTESDLVQIRGDIGWVYPAGHTLGFRYATGVQDDTTDGAFNGQVFDNFFQTTDDNYRIYYRHVAPWGGWAEGFIGWAESDQTVIGLDVNLPVSDKVAFQSGFTAYLDDDGVVPENSNFQGGLLNEGYNLYAGISIQPRGRRRYKSYDRPLFQVADNGSFIIRRESPELTP